MSKNYIDLMLYRSFAEMRAEVSRGFLGMSIWILEPIVYLGAFYLIFSVIGMGKNVDAIGFLLPGLVVWKWFATSLSTGSNAIVNGAHIIQQVHIPKYVLIGTVLLTSFYHFLIVLTLLIIFLLLYGTEPSALWLALVPVILLQCLLIVGTASFFASLIPIYPDMQYIVSNGLTLLFFLSGVFFDINDSTGYIRTILYLNPMAIIIEAYREIFSNGSFPSIKKMAYVFFISALLISVSSMFLKKWERVYPKVLSQ